VFVDFEPVRQHAKCEEDLKKTARPKRRIPASTLEENQVSPARGEMRLCCGRLYYQSNKEINLVLPPGRKVQLGKEASLRTFYELVIRG
jgi:hypothetical protein